MIQIVKSVDQKPHNNTHTQTVDGDYPQCLHACMESESIVPEPATGDATVGQ